TCGLEAIVPNRLRLSGSDSSPLVKGIVLTWLRLVRKG
ncbi:MAG: hypothetical protein ACI81W_002421, partial [Saprospiraceae bacterium]